MKRFLASSVLWLLVSMCFAQIRVRPLSFPDSPELTNEQIDRFYPNILDTVSDRRIAIYEPCEGINLPPIFSVSILHNVGTFDQMFVCAHDSSFNLIDTYYVGKARMFDATSHTIDYKIVGDSSMHFSHVDYGYVERDNEREIDTLKHWEYFLTFDEIRGIKRK